jgi:hypothetical protein
MLFCQDHSQAERTTMTSKIVFAIIPLLMLSCQSSMDSDVDIESGSASLAIADGVTLWNNGKVPICWRWDAGSDAERTLVRQWGDSAWPAVADIDIYGWYNCYPPADKPLGVIGALVTAGPGWPQEMSGCSNGSMGYTVPLNLNIGYFNSTLRPALVNHEFGHCLGFMHEFDRQDFTVPCSPGNGIRADTLGTAANDTNSMMAVTYCGEHAGLDVWDIVGVQRAYGPRRMNNNAALVYVNQAVYRNFPSSAQYIYYFLNDSSGTRFKRWNGSQWSWNSLGQAGDKTTGLPSVTTYREPNGTRYIHVFTRNSNNTLGLHYLTGTTWKKTGLPGTVASEPSATSYTRGDGNIQVDVFYKTTNGDLGQTAYNGSNWLTFVHSLNTKMVGAPSAVTLNDGSGIRKYHVFFRGSDNKLHLQQYNGTNWTEVGALTSNSTMSSDPDAYVSVLGDTLGTRRYDVFWVSTSGELHDYVTMSDGTTWPDINLGNSFPLKQQKVSTAIAYDKDGYQRYWIVGLGTSNNIVLTYWSGLGWTKYSYGAPSGVTLTGVPQIEAHETGSFDRRINIFVKAGTALYSLGWNGTNWAWSNLGSP